MSENPASPLSSSASSADRPSMPQAGPQAGQSSASAPGKEDTNMAMLLYILALVTGFIGPVILWVVKKDSSPFVNDQGKEVLNWCITMVIGYFICFLLVFVVIGIFLIPLLLLTHVIFTILGAVKASKGVRYRYPFALRLLK